MAGFCVYEIYNLFFWCVFIRFIYESKTEPIIEVVVSCSPSVLREHVANLGSLMFSGGLWERPVSPCG